MCPLLRDSVILHGVVLYAHRVSIKVSVASLIYSLQSQQHVAKKWDLRMALLKISSSHHQQRTLNIHTVLYDKEVAVGVRTLMKKIHIFRF